MSGEWATRIVAGLALAAACAALWLSLRAPAVFDVAPERVPPAGASAPVTAADDGRALAALREILLEEVTAREQLASEVEALRAELSAQRPSPGASARAPGAASPAPPAAPWFDADALRAAGLPADEIARLRERFESQELSQLYLRDRAAREGWLGTARFVEESRALSERAKTLRADLGDDRFDWFLFATGQMNRVAVGDVLSTSPAAAAGIAAGDIVLGYDDVRVFTPVDLRDATAGGREGERVPVDLERRGERLRIWVPRGPLGVRLAVRREKPRG